MNQPTRRQARAIALMVPLALYAVLAGQASLAASGSAIPRLSLDDRSVSQTQGLGELQRSLEQLAGSAGAGRQREKRRPASSERLQAALSRLSARETQSELVSTGPRLAGGVGGGLVQDDATGLSGILSSLTTAWRGHAAGEASADKVDVSAVRQAMKRFDLVTDAVVSDTFSRVFLGLSDMAPTLSDTSISHPKVAKDDLRADIVNARIGSASSFSPSLAYEAPTLRAPGTVAAQPDMDVVLDSGSEQIAGLVNPVGEIALSGMSGASDNPWTDPLSSNEQYAMEEEVDMDEIGMDELGDATLASLESPVDAGQLQETRAGFVLNNGVRIDFAVTRLTSVNGLDQLHTITNMPHGLDSTALSKISAGQTDNSNTRVLSPNSGSVFTVIQNDLDNQRIMDVTKIDVGIKNFGLRSTNFIQQSLQGLGGVVPELQR